MEVTSVRKSPMRKEKHCSAPGESSATADEVTGTHTNVIETLAGIEAERRERLLTLVCAGMNRTATRVRVR